MAIGQSTPQRLLTTVALVVSSWCVFVVLSSESLLEPQVDQEAARKLADEAVTPSARGRDAANLHTRRASGLEDQVVGVDQEDTQHLTGDPEVLYDPCYEIFDEESPDSFSNDLCAGAKRVVRESEFLCGDQDCFRDYRVDTPVRITNPAYCIEDCIDDRYQEPVIVSSPEAEIANPYAQFPDADSSDKRIVIRREMKPLQ